MFVLWDFWLNHFGIFVFLCFDLLRAIFEQSPEESYYCILGTEERSHGPSASTGSILVRANVFRQQRALTCLVPLHVEIFFLEDLSESFLGFILLIFSPFVLSYILCFIIIFLIFLLWVLFFIFLIIFKLWEFDHMNLTYLCLLLALIMCLWHLIHHLQGKDILS